MIALLAQAATEKPESLLDALGPLMAIVSLLYAGWTKVRAAKLWDQFRAVSVGLKAYMDALPETEQEERLKAHIEAAAGGKSSPLNQELKASVRKATSGAIKIPDIGAGPTLGAILLCLALLLPACVAAETPRAAARLAATARIIDAAARHHDVYAAQSPEERAASLEAFVALTAEHRRYADELVQASGGSEAEVDALVDKWLADAEARKRKRVAAARTVGEPVVPR